MAESLLEKEVGAIKVGIYIYICITFQYILFYSQFTIIHLLHNIIVLAFRSQELS